MSSSSGGQLNSTHKFARKVRSFVRREGRMSTRQKQAINRLYGEFGVEYKQQMLDLDKVFQRRADKVLEIGFGMGDSLAHMASNNPQQDYLGIEVHRPGVGSLLATMEEKQIKNIRIICHDAVEVLEHMIEDNCLSGVNIFFPDPWPKKRHHKRRLIQPSFVNMLARKTKTLGQLHIATDWKPYAEWIDEVMSGENDFSDATGTLEQYRPVTKFEQRGLKLGHDVWERIYIRKPG